MQKEKLEVEHYWLDGRFVYHERECKKKNIKYLDFDVDWFYLKDRYY
jgi:hypothetical protein